MPCIYIALLHYIFSKNVKIIFLYCQKLKSPQLLNLQQENFRAWNIEIGVKCTIYRLD